MSLPHSFSLADLLAYQLGELDADGERSLEEHIFECSDCAALCEQIDGIAAAVRSRVAGAAIEANVSEAFLRRASDSGLTMREYRLQPSQTVACSAGPEDLYVVRLSGDFGSTGALTAHIDFEDLTSGTVQTLPPRDVLADVVRREVILVFPGSEVRHYPRSMWTIFIDAEVEGGTERIGPYLMDHTP